MASDAIRSIGLEFGAEAALCAEVAIYDPDPEARVKAARALCALMDAQWPEAQPPIPDPDAPYPALTRRFNTASFLLAAIIETRRLAAPLGDRELAEALAEAHGRLLGIVMAARSAAREMEP